MKHCSITFLPEGKIIAIHQGAALLEAAGQAGIILNTPCGGRGTCGKCRVQIGPKKKAVLACQHKVEEDLEVWIPPESRYIQQQILEHGIQRELPAAPTVCKQFLSDPPASIGELQKILSKSLSLPVELHPGGFMNEDLLTRKTGVTAVLFLTGDLYQVLYLESGDTRNTLFGISADIGTTTLVVQLADLLSGEVLQTASSANPQIHYGDDVIGRIHHGQTQQGLQQLHQCLTGRLNELIAEVCRKQKILPEHIYEMTAVGNTTMHHLFLKYPVEQLGQAPYQAYSVTAEDRNARQAGIRIHPAGRLYTVENIAGFVGSDTVAAAVAAGLDTAEPICLLVDIGTNGELVLGSKDRLVSASCAAGPALEGARILFGSRAEEGAIERVIAEGGDIDLDVIGSAPARTLCGSGLIDAVAVMLDLGVIEPSGVFSDKKAIENKVPRAIGERIIEYGNQPAFVLAWKGQSRQPAVVLTQKDIREVQLAKAAIGAGIQLLLKKMNLAADRIEYLYLAGAFGNYIQKHSAIRIGLLPAIPEEKIHFIGNAAGSGAYMVLISRHCRQIASALARKIEYVEIARERDFQDVFADSILFP